MMKTGNHRPSYTHYITFEYDDKNGGYTGFRSYNYTRGVGKVFNKIRHDWYLKDLSNIVNEPPFKTPIVITNFVIVKRGL